MNDQAMTGSVKEKSLSEQIDESVDYQMRTHWLKQAHKELVAARDRLRMAQYAVGESDPYNDAIQQVIVNGLEPLMWKIETEVRSR